MQAQHPALRCRCISHPRCEPAGQEEQTHQEREWCIVSTQARNGNHDSRNPLTPPQWQLNARKTVGTVRSQAPWLSLSFINQATPSCSLYFSTCCSLGVSLLLVAVTQAQEDFDDRSGAELRLPHQVPFRTPVMFFTTTMSNEALLWSFHLQGSILAPYAIPSSERSQPPLYRAKTTSKISLLTKAPSPSTNSLILAHRTLPVIVALVAFLWTNHGK